MLAEQTVRPARSSESSESSKGGSEVKCFPVFFEVFFFFNVCFSGLC